MKVPEVQKFLKGRNIRISVNWRLLRGACDIVRLCFFFVMAFTRARLVLFSRSLRNNWHRVNDRQRPTPRVMHTGQNQTNCEHVISQFFSWMDNCSHDDCDRKTFFLSGFNFSFAKIQTMNYEIQCFCENVLVDLIVLTDEPTLVNHVVALNALFSYFSNRIQSKQES